jgi:hypothetical protein
MENVLVGTKGWEHKLWQNDFYPCGLPKDWELDYYSNQFYCVLVSQQQWQHWSVTEIESIAESLAEENFFITLQVESLQNSEKDKLKEIQHLFGYLLHGVLLFSMDDLSFYQQELSVEITIKSANYIKFGIWSFQNDQDYYCGFPLLVLNLFELKIVKQKDILIDFEKSLLNIEIGGLIYIASTEKNKKDILVNKVIEFKVLVELLGL